MPIKNAFEMLIKIFYGKGTELVKDASDFHAIISVGVVSIPGGQQQPICLLTVLVQFGRIVMAITQDERTSEGTSHNRAGAGAGAGAGSRVTRDA